MTCKCSVAATEEDAREIALAAISVERDDGVDVLEERRQWLRMRRIDLVGGHVSVAFYTISATSGHVKTGRLRALGLTGLTRSPAVDRKSTRLNSSHMSESRMPSSA